MALCPAIFDGRILPLYVTDLPQAFAERGHEVRPFGGGLAAEQTDHRHSGLLRPRRERPCRRTAEECDELAPPHRRPRGFRQAIVPDQATIREAADVRFGSKADMCAAKRDVRFTPDSDRKSGHRQPVMSALPPIADSCSAQAHVCFGPKADIFGGYSTTSSARNSNDCGTVRSSAFAVLVFIAISNFTGT